MSPMQALLDRLVQLLPGLTGALRQFAAAIPQMVMNAGLIARAVQAIASSPIVAKLVQVAAPVVGPVLRAAGAVAAPIGQALGALASGLGSLLAPLVPALGAVAGLAGPVAGVAVALVALGSVVAVVGKAFLETQRHLAEFSPAMAAVFAQSDVRTMQRDVKAGDERAGSTGFLADALNDLQDTLRPIVSLLTNILNVLAGVLTKAVEMLLKPLSIIADVVNRILAWLFKDETDFINVGKWMDEVREDARKGRAQGDPGFKFPQLARD